MVCICECMVSYLCNIDEGLVKWVVVGLVMLVLFDLVVMVMLVQNFFVVLEVCVIGWIWDIFKGCCIGILFDVGLDVGVINVLCKVVVKVGVSVKLVVFKIGGGVFSDGKVQLVDGQFVGMFLVVFDVVVVVFSVDVVK